MGFNYHFPLCYPDVGFANIFYLLRIRAHIFYDDTKVNDFHTNGNAYNLEFRSAGTEIFFETKWWNQVGIDFGFRYSRLLDPDLYGNKSSNRWEIILPVNILNK